MLDIQQSSTKTTQRRKGINLRFHAQMTRAMRQSARSHIQQITIEIKRLSRAIDKAEDLGQPVKDLLQEHAVRQAEFCMAWVIYRKASHVAAYWAERYRAQNNPAAILRDILKAGGANVDARAIGEAIHFCELPAQGAAA